MEPKRQAPPLSPEAQRGERGRGEGVPLGVVDADAIVRAWVRASLADSEFSVVGEATRAAEAAALVERSAPALLLVDYRLPDGSGLELVRLLRRQGVRIPTLLTTTTPSPGLNEAVTEAGGQGVILKRGDPDTLLAALRTLAGGGSYADPVHPRRPADQPVLSPRERAVLAAAAAGATNSEIARQFGLGTETVKTLLSRAFSKLGARNRMEAVRAAQERGLL